MFLIAKSMIIWSHQCIPHFYQNHNPVHTGSNHTETETKTKLLLNFAIDRRIQKLFVKIS